MFILSSNAKLEPELSCFDRLYAYPNIPHITPDHFIILDSGAFALSCKKQRMDEQYIQALAKHYTQYGQSKNVHCIAPDVFKFPEQSMQQFLYFKDICSVNVAPVIQFKSPVADVFAARKQIRFYKQHAPDLKLICISNHAFNIEKEAGNVALIVKIIQQEFNKCIKIHVLGAGFNSVHVAQWMKTGVDSMDSISYYTDAQAKQAWQFGKASVETSTKSFKELALMNASIAIKSALNYQVIA